MYCTFCLAKCLCKVSTSDIHSSFFRWHLKHDLTHGSKDQKGSHEEGEGGHMCVTKDGICKQFRPCIQKRVLSLFFTEKYKHPPCFHPSMSIIIYPYKSREMAKNRVVFFTWKWWQLNNSIDFACSLLTPPLRGPSKCGTWVRPFWQLQMKIFYINFYKKVFFWRFIGHFLSYDALLL